MTTRPGILRMRVILIEVWELGVFHVRLCVGRPRGDRGLQGGLAGWFGGCGITRGGMRQGGFETYVSALVVGASMQNCSLGCSEQVWNDVALLIGRRAARTGKLDNRMVGQMGH